MKKSFEQNGIETPKNPSTAKQPPADEAPEPFLSRLEKESLFTVEEIAVGIKYHPGSVLRAIRDGRIHAVPFGQGWRIPASEARRILATGLPYRSNTKASGSTRRCATKGSL